MLLGHLQISPHLPLPGGLFLFLHGTGEDPLQAISIVSFRNRRRTSGGAFYDYSARYSAVQEEDRITLRQNMFLETMPREKMPYEDDFVEEEERPMLLSENERQTFDELVGKMGLDSFLDLPMIALSNGQTRRARILKAIVAKPRPELLLLDKPLTFVKGGKVVVGNKEQVLRAELESSQQYSISGLLPSAHQPAKVGEIVADLQNVKLQYQDRKVLKNLNWQIRQGSGKTTLLSLLTSDHPQSYTQLTHLHLFSKPRSHIPTPQLRSMIGVLSPEIFDAFPRRPALSRSTRAGQHLDLDKSLREQSARKVRNYRPGQILPPFVPRGKILAVM
ncbi:hypothetical protein VKT23_016342 [Stygiomarasmius scandens]|uniref:ABC transporter domain-containing protein n=1 Tax=Marasmiellus scandens TaxID=2682957 RepID=A0ABR1IWW6_9AGAR